MKDNTENMHDRLEQLTSSLFNQSNELHFIKAALSSLERALHWQTEQPDAYHWEVLSSSTILALQKRQTELEHSVTNLTEEQAKTYETVYGNLSNFLA